MQSSETLADPYEAKLRLILDYCPDKVAHFLCFGGAQHASSPWLFNPASVGEQSPEELAERFDLPFHPNLVCDAVVQPGTRVKVYVVVGRKDAKVYRAEGDVVLSNERKL